MAMQVCMGAEMMCSFGAAPSSLVVLPVNKTFTDQVPDANIMDHVPMVNIMPFGVCMSIANPEVASATAAALGVLTPSSLQRVADQAYQAVGMRDWPFAINRSRDLLQRC